MRPLQRLADRGFRKSPTPRAAARFTSGVLPPDRPSAGGGSMRTASELDELAARFVAENARARYRAHHGAARGRFEPFSAAAVIRSRSRMSKLLVLLIMLASLPAEAGTPLFRLGATVGLQQSDRSAWVFGPLLDVSISHEFSIRAEGQVELGDLDDPFGDSNFRSGHGPHVNHAFVGATWRPMRFADFALATGAEAGVMIMHSHFSYDDFVTEPALGLFVQAGRVLGPVSIALQLRLDVSATVAEAGPGGADVQTTCARLNLVFEVPVLTR